MINNTYNGGHRIVTEGDHMNLRSLKYFVAIAEHRHFGKAAKSCYVSQPALSMQIKAFEEYLGVQLIERSNKSVLLTEIGDTLLQQALTILEQVEALHEIVKDSHDPYRGGLKMGIIPTLAPYLLPNLMRSLSKKFPNLTIFIAEELTNCLIEKLKTGKLDTILLAPPISAPDLITYDLFCEELILITPKQHYLAKRKKIHLQDLKDTRLLLVKDADDSLRTLTLSLCQEMKAHEIFDFRATSLQTLNHMVATGVGIAVIPKSACQKNCKVATVSLINAPTRKVGMIWRKNSAKARLLKDISLYIRNLRDKIIC